MTVAMGDTLFIPRNPALGVQSDHHYVVVSSPAKDPNEVVLLRITTFENYKDDSCVFGPTDCGRADFVDHLSCIDYRDPIIVPLAAIEQLLSRQAAKRKPVIPQALLARIHRGAAESNRVHPKVALILVRQNLLP
jgi:hypothetical protein